MSIFSSLFGGDTPAATADVPASQVQDNSSEGGDYGGGGDDVQPATMHPVLQDFRDVMGSAGAEEGGWADHVSTILNDHLVKSQIADHNEAIGNAFVQNLTSFRNGLLQFVQNDPTGLDTALQVVQPTIAGIVGNQEKHPPEQMQDTHDQIVQGLHQDVIRAAVQKMAEHDPDAAKGMLDTYGQFLNDTDKAGLGNYITQMVRAKVMDHAAGIQQGQAATAIKQNGIAAQQLGALYSQDFGGFAAPAGWSQKLYSDPNITPQNKFAMDQAFQRLSKFGDARNSDPSVMLPLMKQIADGQNVSAVDLANTAGRNIRMRDLSSMIDPSKAALFGHMYNTAQMAKGILEGRDGENGAVGIRAFNLYFNNMMDQVWRGTGTLDPYYQPKAAQNVPGQPAITPNQVYLGDPGHIATFHKLALEQTKGQYGGGIERRGVMEFHGGAAVEQQQAIRAAEQTPAEREAAFQAERKALQPGETQAAAQPPAKKSLQQIFSNPSPRTRAYIPTPRTQAFTHRSRR